MAFTDDDLKRLKEDIYGYEIGQLTNIQAGIGPNQGKALLHRLECAEKYINVSVCDPDITAEMWTAWEAWRKSKGESGGSR